MKKLEFFFCSIKEYDQDKLEAAEEDWLIVAVFFFFYSVPAKVCLLAASFII